MSKYQYLKTKVNRILEDKNCLTTEVLNYELENLVQELLSTIQELESVEIDPEFFEWQKRKYKLHSCDWEYVFKEKSDGTRVKVDRVYNDDGDIELYKPKRLRSPDESSSYVEGLNWSTYWLTLDKDFKLVRFEPSNRINEIFEDSWSTYEFNALGYKTPNGTIVHYDSYIED
jgi:hypothetical protein